MYASAESHYCHLQHSLDRTRTYWMGTSNDGQRLGVLTRSPGLRGIGLDLSSVTPYKGPVPIRRRVTIAVLVVIAAAGLGALLLRSCGLNLASGDGSTAGSQGTQAPGSSAAAVFEMQLGGGVTARALRGTPSCSIRGLQPGSPHRLDFEFDVNPATQTKVFILIPGVAAGTYTPSGGLQDGVTDASGLAHFYFLSDPAVQRLLPAAPSGAHYLETGTLSAGKVKLLSVQPVTGSGHTLRISNLSGEFDLTFTLTFTALCEFCKAPPPVVVVAKATGTFSCPATA